MSELVRCKQCNEEWEVENKNRVLTFTGLCWLCHNIELNIFSSSDCVTKTLRDFRNSSQDEYNKWLLGGNSLTCLPDPQKRQLNALLKLIEDRKQGQDKLNV
jgi:hypothetical protein